MSVSYNTKIVTNGLVSYLDAGNKKSYPGTGTIWYDLTNNNNATLVNGATFYSANNGFIGFDGIDDYSTSGTLLGSFSSFTVIVWFYPMLVTNYQNPIDCNFLYNATTGNIGPRLEMDSSGNLTWVYSNITNNVSSFYAHTVVSSGLKVNTWHCSAITYNGQTNSSITYYNGSDTGFSRSVNGSPSGFIGVMNNVVIGKGYSNNAARIFMGRVSNVKIYNRALSASEISQNFNALRGRYGI